MRRMMTTIMNMELTDTASLRWRKKLSKLDLRTDNVMNILGDMMDIFEETNQDIVKWVDRVMQHIMNIRVMFESVDTELDNVEIHGFKILMLDELESISAISEQKLTYMCSILTPSSLLNVPWWRY